MISIDHQCYSNEGIQLPGKTDEILVEVVK